MEPIDHLEPVGPQNLKIVLQKCKNLAGCKVKIVTLKESNTI